MKKISLMKSTFYNEKKVKEDLCSFITKTNKLSMGENCEKFEEKFSKWQDSKFSVMFNSGSSANLAIIQALLNLKKIKKGDKIAVSALTWSTNVMPIIQLGLEPVLIDVSIDTLNVNSNNFLDALKKHKIKALFITNLLGFCDDLDVILKICKKNKIILLEDNCESLGSSLNSKKLGNFSEMSSFSMYVGHHLSAIEGGIVSTNSESCANMLKMIRAHGWARSLPSKNQDSLMKKHKINSFFNQYTFYELGYNIRPNEITGFIANSQLLFIDEIIRKRQENFKYFYSLINESKNIYRLNVDHMDIISNFSYPLVFKNQALFLNAINIFKGNNIEIRPIVAGNIAVQPFFKKYFKVTKKLLNSDKAHKFGFYFPNNPDLNKRELNTIGKCLKEIF